MGGTEVAPEEAFGWSVETTNEPAPYSAKARLARLLHRLAVFPGHRSLVHNAPMMIRIAASPLLRVLFGTHDEHRAARCDVDDPKLRRHHFFLTHRPTHSL